jgi:hypothetical protein
LFQKNRQIQKVHATLIFKMCQTKSMGRRESVGSEVTVLRVGLEVGLTTAWAGSERQR